MSLCRDLATETSHRDFEQRPGEDSRDLAKRSFIFITDIFCGGLLQTPCTDSLAKGLHSNS